MDNNIINFDHVTFIWYKKLKRVSYQHLNMDIRDAEDDSLSIRQPLKSETDFIRSINVITVNKELSPTERLRWLLLLMLQVYSKHNNFNLTNNDLNFIGDHLYHKYANEELEGIRPTNRVLSNKVLKQFETWIDALDK